MDLLDKRSKISAYDDALACNPQVRDRVYRRIAQKSIDERLLPEAELELTREHIADLVYNYSILKQELAQYEPGENPSLRGQVIAAGHMMQKAIIDFQKQCESLQKQYMDLYGQPVQVDTGTLVTQLTATLQTVLPNLSQQMIDQVAETFETNVKVAVNEQTQGPVGYEPWSTQQFIDVMDNSVPQIESDTDA